MFYDNMARPHEVTRTMLGPNKRVNAGVTVSTGNWMSNMFMEEARLIY